MDQSVPGLQQPAFPGADQFASSTPIDLPGAPAVPPLVTQNDRGDRVVLRPGSGDPRLSGLSQGTLAQIQNGTLFHKTSFGYFKGS